MALSRPFTGELSSASSFRASLYSLQAIDGVTSLALDSSNQTKPAFK